MGVFDAIIAGFDLSPSSEILDLGCGTGNVAIPLVEPGGGIACLSRNSRFCQATYH